MPSPRPLRAADFEYTYPPELIAQHPTRDRAGSRLLVVDRETQAIAHRRFEEFPTLLRPGDVLVLNASRVMPARLCGTRASGAPAEVLLVHALPDGTWHAMVHPGGKLRAGRRVRFGPGAEVEILGTEPGGLRRIRFTGTLDAAACMERFGQVPLPPYIQRDPVPQDHDRYQTVYAERDGSVAAPTAGLHFSRALLDRVRDRGVIVTSVVLHIGPGTFKPVEVEDPSRHVMHREWYEVPPPTADAVSAARAAGGRIWAVGTTTARTLESAAEWRGGGDAAWQGGPEAGSVTSATPTTSPPGWGVVAGSAWTDLFIRPPYEFRVVDALLTNFHLPRSTLLMLVSAFAGHDLTMRAYREAVAQRYRLYSYGDAMAIA